MYKKGIYKNLREVQTRKKVEEKGFNPIKINDPPGRIYSEHTHPETKLLAILKGDMDVKSADKQYKLIKGDELIIDGNVVHSAVVGKSGCEFFWSEKLV